MAWNNRPHVPRKALSSVLLTGGADRTAVPAGAAVGGAGLPGGRRDHRTLRPGRRRVGPGHRGAGRIRRGVPAVHDRRWSCRSSGLRAMRHHIFGLGTAQVVLVRRPGIGFVAWWGFGVSPEMATGDRRRAGAQLHRLWCSRCSANRATWLARIGRVGLFGSCLGSRTSPGGADPGAGAAPGHGRRTGWRWHWGARW